ncbi:MAG: hypothetical protein LBH31_09575, partial [Burkholderiaceae bacterium]|nr:hypothetical protein [Burkholderiaceae bacterium]
MNAPARWLCVLVVAACCAACTGLKQQPSHPVQSVQAKESQEPSESEKIDNQALETLFQTTDKRSLDWDDYDKLVQGYTAGLPTTVAGTPKLFLAFDALQYYYDHSCFAVLTKAPKRARQTFIKENRELDKWIKRRPESATFVVAKAILAGSYAWYLRGDGTVDTVNPRVWPEFNAVISNARNFLLKNKTVGQTSPMWYMEMLFFARVEPGNPGAPELLHEGIQRYPGFMPIYWAAMESALPKWGGSPEAVEQVARSAQGTEYGDMVYAYVWYNAVLDCNCELSKVMIDAARKQASWPDMQRGWEQRAQKYP